MRTNMEMVLENGFHSSENVCKMSYFLCSAVCPIFNLIHRDDSNLMKSEAMASVQESERASNPYDAMRAYMCVFAAGKAACT